ncbi:heme exporter protein CcmD [Cohaesibacter haloalkalitolerans]|uniref:heme exporter protein CcmD n=1 Tax=Cohaesibacter haloalkalitolerans TaxID=1162980 RepID=UPI000E64B768|nr:heme exporter protein CcmD [Cohaesibacter haloalkalitolerans]
MFGNYAGFILASYGVTAATILLLVLWVILDGQKQAKILAQLHERGIHRRSERAKAAANS